MKWTSGFNIGILSGMALGFLLAPAKGSETRERVSQQIRRCSRKMQQLCRSKNADIEVLKDNLRQADAELTPEMRWQLLKLIKKAEHAIACEKRETQQE